MVALSKFALIATGVAPDKLRDDPVRFVQIRDLTGARKDLTVGERPLVARALPIQAGDILVAARGERTLAAEADEDLFGAYASLDLYLVRPEATRLDPSFLLAFLLLPQTGVRLRASTAGASLPRIARDDIAQLDLPDLPLERQRSIGQLARAHRTHRELLIQLAERHATAADLQILEALRVSTEG
ncbi:hypothetical protein [Methylopila turkensis]|uniref:Type I restriction modification DNA specificity domain-containing protein n=1 Tax=Methylopila turkensis TaxID=1437816 RepID=A0A9W6JKS6_9HYPH|nr:hypothetical protein [Methylopila turkensis]GLK79007.1 hypothetical protein GCM10008174_07480 [Methylopila turkensis]